MRRTNFTKPYHKIRTLDAGLHINAVWFNEGGIGIQHRCRIVEDDEGKVQLVCAPLIETGEGKHTILSNDPLTIRPSVQCGDCGLHGFVTDGKWVSA